MNIHTLEHCTHIITNYVCAKYYPIPETLRRIRQIGYIFIVLADDIKQKHIHFIKQDLTVLVHVLREIHSEDFLYKGGIALTLSMSSAMCAMLSLTLPSLMLGFITVGVIRDTYKQKDNPLAQCITLLDEIKNSVHVSNFDEHVADNIRRNGNNIVHMCEHFIG